MTDARKLAVLRAELRRVEGRANPSSPGVSAYEYALMERAQRHGTIAALRTRGTWGEFSAARGLIRRGLAEKVDEGKRFLRIRLTPKGEEALRASPEGRRSYGTPTPDGRVIPRIYREIEDYEYNPFREYRAKKRPISHRDMALLAHLERRGAGAGKHSTRTRDEETGRARRLKHGGKDAYVEREYPLDLRENPLSGREGLHVVARRHSPHPKYGSEFSFSYATKKIVFREVKTKQGRVYTSHTYQENWQEDAENFFEEYDSGYYANTDLTIFALDAQGVRHPLTIAAVRHMADTGSLPTRLVANRRR